MGSSTNATWRTAVTSASSMTISRMRSEDFRLRSLLVIVVLMMIDSSHAYAYGHRQSQQLLLQHTKETINADIVDLSLYHEIHHPLLRGRGRKLALRRRQLQGAGGGGGGGGGGWSGGGGGGYHYHSSSSYDDDYRDDDNDITSIDFCVILSFFATIFGCACYQNHFTTQRRNKLRSSNREWVLRGRENNTSTITEEVISSRPLPIATDAVSDQSHQTSFPSGRWKGYYRQYNQDHSLMEFNLFSSEDENNGNYAVLALKGNGTDDVGQYTIEGVFCHGRMALTKYYIAGTGNPNENKGHSVDYRGELRQGGNFGFGIRGTWDVMTNNYTGTGIFHLWPTNLVSVEPSQPQQPSAPPKTLVMETVPAAEESCPLLEVLSDKPPQTSSTMWNAEAGRPVSLVEENDDECAVCFDSRVNTMLYPCGHVALCSQCANQLSTCPICRAPIDVRRILLHSQQQEQPQ